MDDFSNWMLKMKASLIFDLIKIKEKILYYINIENLRKGQSLFNAVYAIRPDIADSLRGTDKDCFYNDEKINDFMEEVMLNLRKTKGD